MSRLMKRSLSLAGHATSVALEAEFWRELEHLAETSGLGLAALIRRIDEQRGRTPLASACRLQALAHARSRPPGAA